jgi:hypothetical protein
MSKKWPFKDPLEVLDYGFNWSTRNIGDATIITTSCEVKSGSVHMDLMEVGPVPGAADGQGTITWLSGGELGETCELFLLCTTDQGHTIDQTIMIQIKQRT